MKKYGLILATSLCLTLSLVACGKKTESNGFDTDNEVATTSDVSTEVTTEGSSDADVLPDQKDVIDSDEKWQDAHGGETTEEATDDDNDLAEETNLTTDDSKVEKVPVTGDDTFGSLNGVGFDLKDSCLDFTETFGKAGFDFVDDKDSYTDVSYNPFHLTNGNASIVVTVSREVNGELTDNSINNIINEGFTSYYVDVTDTVASSRPYMTFKGCTWGASADDIIAAYGEPLDFNGISTKDAINRLTYDYENYTIEFSVYNPTTGSTGLQKVFVHPRAH